MMLKQKIVIAVFGIFLGLASVNLNPSDTFAAECGDKGTSTLNCKENSKKCGGVNTSIISCSEGDGKGGLENSGVWGLLLLTLNIMTAGIGILAVGGIVYGAVLYTSAGDKAEQTKKAIGIITNVVIGIVAYGLMYLVLNFLIPGGIFT